MFGLPADANSVDSRKELSENLANFVPTLQLVNAGTEKSISEKLDFFRTEVLAKLDPVDEKKQAADAAMDEMLASTVGLDAFDVREVPIITTRVGMYVYLNAAVGLPNNVSTWHDANGICYSLSGGHSWITGISSTI